MAPIPIVDISPFSFGKDVTLHLAQTVSSDIVINTTRSVHANFQSSFLHVMAIIAAIIGVLIFSIAFFILWKWASKWWEQRVSDNRCFETQQQLECLGLREHKWSDYPNGVPILPRIEWSQAMESSQTLVGGFLYGNGIELDGGITVILDGDVVRMADQDREEDWETESEDDEKGSNSDVVSIIGPLCIEDLEDCWGGTEPSEIEEDELGDPEGDVVTCVEAEEVWQEKALEEPARAYLIYSNYV